MKKILKEHERIDDLQVDGLKIIQNPEWFCFGIDAVIISHFTEVKRGQKVVEFGTGTGIIPLLLAGKKKATKITAFEIQEDVADMARRSVELNDLEEVIEILHADLKSADQHVAPNSIDVVVSNPPYVISGGGLKNPDSQKALSRHEIACTLEDIFKSAYRLLRSKGSFYMVHRPSRLVDIMALARNCRMEPKVIRFVQPKGNKKPNIMLIKFVKDGNPELKFMDPLIVYEASGAYTKEIFEIYDSENISSFERNV